VSFDQDSVPHIHTTKKETARDAPLHGRRDTMLGAMDLVPSTLLQDQERHASRESKRHNWWFLMDVHSPAIYQDLKKKLKGTGFDCSFPGQIRDFIFWHPGEPANPVVDCRRAFKTGENELKTYQHENVLLGWISFLGPVSEFKAACYLKVSPQCAMGSDSVCWLKKILEKRNSVATKRCQMQRDIEWLDALCKITHANLGTETPEVDVKGAAEDTSACQTKPQMWRH